MLWNDAEAGTGIAQFGEFLSRKLPSGWLVELGSYDAQKVASRNPEFRIDAFLRLRGPDGAIGAWVVEIKNRLEPRDVSQLLAQVRRLSDEPILVLAPFIGEEAQRRLAESGASYADETGNVRLVLDRPALYIEMKGAGKNPKREERPLQSLKGPSASRVVRALCDFSPPYGIRELSARAEIPTGSISRVIDLLAREALIERDSKGQVLNVDWPAVLYRWSRDYDVLKSNRVASYFDPRGLSHLLSKLPSCSETYAVSGSLAASLKAPVASPRLALIYVWEAPDFATALGLRHVDTNANVLLLRPKSSAAFERTWKTDGVVYTGLSQVAVDLMNSPGRGPAEAEALLAWMKDHTDVWRV